MATNLILNGEYLPEDSNLFNLRNRALTYGECIMETIHSCADRLCFFDEHMEHMRQGMGLAMLPIPQKFLNENQEFYQEVSKLLSKNRTFRSANVTIMTFRELGTTYTPEKMSYLVTEDPLEYLGYELNKETIKVDLMEDIRKPASIFSPYLTHDNGLMRYMIRKQCITKRVNDMILLNQDGHIVESASGYNIFFVADGVLHTPPTGDGCKTDIMRAKVIEVAKAMGIKVEESEHVSPEILDRCNEIFLSNTAYGIRWVGAYRHRRFIKSKAQAILNKINEIYQAERTNNADATNE